MYQRLLCLAGVPVEVPIVVVAEDGVTSLRYFLNVLRALPPANASAHGGNATGAGGGFNGTAMAPGGGGGGLGLGLAGGPGGALQILGGGGPGGGSKETGLAELSESLPAQHRALQPGDRRWPANT